MGVFRQCIPTYYRINVNADAQEALTIEFLKTSNFHIYLSGKKLIVMRKTFIFAFNQVLTAFKYDFSN